MRDKILFFTHTPEAGHDADTEVPARLMPDLGIQHHRIDLQKMTAHFEEYDSGSVCWARERHGHIAFTALDQFGPEATVLNSNISEYSQVCFWLPPSRITGEGLAVPRTSVPRSP